MTPTLERVPPHLRRYVVEQNYAEYTAVDQAVWRFVLLQMYAKLQHTAHPAYRNGLSETGISVERIPSLKEMDDCLSRFGWGAVAVNGFIPPRAFTEFQALGLLPICAEIRTADHLVYTPAPDIIHEAAGHAPIIVDPHYADFLKRIGEVGARAFRLPEDDAVYDAIFALSEIKERPGAAHHEISEAEAALERANRNVRRVSEATRVSRLYWWTAEYGLVGTVDDYKLFGAGLLSSLWESHSCHDPTVTKLPLSIDCASVDYDITRAQPQLFVARDFDQLGDVLDQLADTLAYKVGGAEALVRAVESQELCTLTLDTGLELIGHVKSAEVVGDTSCTLVRMVGRHAFAEAGRIVDGPAPQQELWLLVGTKADGTSLAGLDDLARTAQPFELSLGGDLVLSGTHADPSRAAHHPALVIERPRLQRGGWVLTIPGATVLFAGRVASARAGAVDANFYDSTGFSAEVTPSPRSFPPAERAMLELYARALAAHDQAMDSEMVKIFAAIHQTLQSDSPSDWLLRWNMLESLVKRGLQVPLTHTLRTELTVLERDFRGRQPIASGLRYLGFG